MGIAAGQKMSDVIDRFERDARQLDFFGAVSLLEEYFIRRGVGDPVQSGRIQFEPDPSLTFPPSDIVAIERRADRIVFTLAFMGLVGVTSPLPVYFADFVAAHDAEAEPLRDFLTIFNNRMYALFYRAWKKYRLMSMTVRGNAGDSLYRTIAALAAIPASPAAGEVHQERLLAYTGLFAGGARSGAGLCAMLGDFFGSIPVRVQEYMPRWAPLPDPTRLGERENARLGTHTILGTSVFDRSGKFRVVIGPLPAAPFESFLPNGTNHTLAKQLIEAYLFEPL
ncbi:MAG: type VI secretion system baseplate subunit TssG, partial [Chitinispirillaceae bacterium]|nr:type VI secretion system baseplate subunit TssG [Chitinispirillaceae bacterium]